MFIIAITTGVQTVVMNGDSGDSDDDSATISGNKVNLN